MLTGMQHAETTTDVTSAAYATLPTGLSIANSSTHKVYKNGNVITLTLNLSRTSDFVSGTSFQYINDGYRPQGRIFGIAFGAKNTIIPVYITPEGKVTITFKDNTDTAAIITFTYLVA